MIEDVSETLRGILKRPGLPNELRSAQIVFDQPTETFKPTLTTIDLFLFELRENHDARIDDATLPLACTYLVTTWPVGGLELALQEHRLLSQVLQVFMAYPTIPAHVLKGRLAGQNPLPHLTVMRRDVPTSAAGFWSSLGCKPRPSLSVTVAIGVPVVLAADLGNAGSPPPL